MAEEKSNELAAALGVPSAFQSSENFDANVYSKTVSFTPSLLAVNDFVRLFRLPSRAVVHEFRVSHAAYGAGSAYDVGVYEVDGGVLDADALSASPVLMSSAARTSLVVEIAEVSRIPVADQLKFLWQYAGASKDPGGFYDIALTVETVLATPQLTHARIVYAY